MWLAHVIVRELTYVWVLCYLASAVMVERKGSAPTSTDASGR